MNVHTEGNRLYFDEQEVWESNSGREGAPAHDQEIVCFASSPDSKRIVSVDKTGKLKVWDPHLANMSQCVWRGNGFAGATAVGVTNDGSRLAVAIGLMVTIYSLMVPKHEPAEKIEANMLPPGDKITSLTFADNNSVICDYGKVIGRRNPAWVFDI